jgi:uncharacterized membrane protein YphA (DoxX/SURF4 family)
MTVQKLFITIAIISAIISFFRNRLKRNGDGFFLNLVQYFVGFLFIFSGIVKGIDPTGTGYKMKDYFESFAHDGWASFWEKMTHFNISFALGMIIFEIILGIAIIIGWRARWTALGLLGINLFFLYLTGYSYLSGFCLSQSILVVSAILLALLFGAAFIQNHKKRFQGIITMSVLVLLYFIYIKSTGNGIGCPFTISKMKVTDCGCFGDFMKLKPWETFYKDVFLTILSLFLAKKHHKISELFSGKVSNMIMIGGLALTTIFCLYNTYFNEPPVDFRPYAIGNNINEKMKEIEPSIIENILIYTNKTTGQDQRFGISNIPMDTNWVYKDRIDSVIKEGIPAPIHNLRFEGRDGNDVTTSILNEPSVSYWIVCYNIDKSDLKVIDEKLIPFATEMRAKGLNVYFMVGKSDATVEKKVGSVMDIVRADETALKTMIRSNPGILKIQNGVVQNKWHYKVFNGDK